MTDRTHSAEFTELREYENRIRAKYDDPYGRDYPAYDRARQADPEWARLREAFAAAYRAAQGSR